MGPWPATPQVEAKRTLVTSMGSAQAGNLGLAARDSPASTDGDTVGEASFPTTPADDVSLHHANASAAGKPVHTVWSGRAPHLGILGDHQPTFPNSAWNRLPAEYPPSPSDDCNVEFVGRASQLAVTTPEANKISTPGSLESGSRQQASTPSFCGSPLARTADSKRGVITPSAGVDDPFLERKPGANSEAVASTSSHVVTVKTESSAEFFSPGKESTSSTPFRPRRDRDIEEVSSDNAQAVFPPHACVFVANLVSTSSDEQLQKSVERAFSRFGRVYVKIKRDPRGMPFAFAQYENVEDSNKAITEGRGLVINGRQCRTERAKVNRTLYLVRVLGGAVSEDEARQVLAGCGDLEKIWHCSPTEKECYRLPEGIWVTFAFFQDARDAQSQFKEHTHFRLEQPEGPYPMRLTRGSPLRAGAIYTTLNVHTTVCISNLPPDINPTQIREMFGHVGGCGEVEIVSRPTRSDVNGHEVFAFAEFASESQAKAACRDGYQIDSYHLRVEYGNLADVRAASNRVANQFGSPRARRSGGHDSLRTSHREQCIARALSYGVHPSTIAQIYDGTALGGGGDHFGSPMHAAPYGGPFVHQPFSGAFNSPAGTNDQQNNSVYAAAHVGQSNPSYPYAQLPNGQYYPMLPGPYVFPSINEANNPPSNNAAPADGHAADPST